jgi:hypothetical protein
MSENPGIDYGRGLTNIDRETGIRYGVIPVNDVLQGWADSAEADYGPPHCPKCGNEAGLGSAADAPDFEEEEYEVDGAGDYYCADCKWAFDADECYGEEPIAFILDNGEYRAQQSGDDTDIFILKSPYYTHAQFCSPCAPGAGYLRNPVADGPKTYCFGPDWFDEDIEPCPYPVYRVSDDECIYTPKQAE